jgi:hypothetical protein
MSDQRHQYVAERLGAALDGIKYSPSIVSVFDNAKVQEELAKFYAANGPPCIAFVVDRVDETSQQHKLSFHSGAPKTTPANRSAAAAAPSLLPFSPSPRLHSVVTVDSPCAPVFRPRPVTTGVADGHHRRG